MNENSNKKFMKKISYSALFEKDQESGGYCASVPSLPGCYSCGETLSEAQRNLREALELYVGVFLESGKDLPNDKKLRHKAIGIYKNLSVVIQFNITSRFVKQYV